MPSIRDVAQRADVSTATVTRVLNGSPRVSAERRARVLRAIRELDYVPNAAARALTLGRSNQLGLLIPDIANPFFAEIAQGLEDRASEVGYQCLVATSHLQEGREEHFVTAFLDRTLAAVAITPSGKDSTQIKRLAESNLPIVFVDRKPIDLAGPTVRTDGYAAAKDAVRYLIGLGHTSIAMVAGPETFTTTSQRVAGFHNAMREAGMPISDGVVTYGHLEIDGGYQGMSEVLDLNPRPTAVFTFNNLLTVGALGALRDRVVRVPDDISLMSFDDMTLFPFTNPPITAVAQPAYEMGVATADLLLSRLERPTNTEHDVVFPTTFHERGSCSPPATRG